MTTATQDTAPAPIAALFPAFHARPEQPLEEALDESREAAARYGAWLRAVPEDALHEPLAPGKWSPAEHADHISRMALLFAALMDGCAEGRPMPEAERALQWPDGRIVAPGPVTPVPGRPREALLADLEAGQGRMEAAARRLRDAGSLGVPCVPTGIFVPMTGLAAVQLVTEHRPHHAPAVPARG